MVAGSVYSPASSDGTTSTSTVTIIPQESHTNRSITCKAENQEIRAGVLKETWSLNVQYPPRILLELTSMLESQSVAEGNDVFFVCKIRSNPPIDRMVEWFHNDKPLKQNQRKGIIMNSSGTNLVLQKVKKEANGNYTCRATNGVPSVGHYAESKPFHLDIKYLPVCVPEGVKVYGVAKEENVRIRCQVAANPSNLTFRWTFNNSAEIKDVDRSKFSMNHSVSLFSYKPERELDYGTLMCWSRNPIGEQQKPCVFHIIAAGRPDPVKNCTTSNVNNSAFQINCSPGFNGGLPQNFTIEVIENETLDAVVFRGSDTAPVFSVTNLKDSTDYRVYVIPVNMKGPGQPQSPSGTLVRTLTAPQPITAEKPNFHKENQSDQINPIMVVIFGGATGFLLIVVTITLAVRVRCSQRPPELAREESKVVVTTIADLEFSEDHLTDRVPLSSSKSGITSPDLQTGKDILEFDGSSQSGGYSVDPEQEYQQQQNCSTEPGSALAVEQLGVSDHHPPFLMLPPMTQHQHSMNFYTLRKPPHHTKSTFSKHPEELGGCSRRSAQEFIAQYREKQKAGFMYGTLRPNSNMTYQDFADHTCSVAQGVLPPPPAFEEGNINPKTPLLTKKAGKSDKKDKMESRV